MKKHSPSNHSFNHKFRTRQAVSGGLLFCLIALSLIGWGVKASSQKSGQRNQRSAPPPPAIITVNSTSDGLPANNGQCTLREAILNANGNDQSGSTDCASGSDADTILFSLPVGPQTINLTGPLPNLTESLTINGPGAALLTVRRATGGEYRIFTIPVVGLTISLSGMTIRDGRVTGEYGGGIISNSSLTLTECSLTNNEASSGGGGGITLNADGTFTRCTISGNTADFQGGGIHFEGSGGRTLILINSTISGNTVNNNGYGGGIFNASFSGHSGLQVTNCTIADNNAPVNNAGGIATGATGGGVTATTSLYNSIIANNSLPNLLRGSASGGNASVLSQGYNLANDNGSGCLTQVTDQINKPPLLAPLDFYGGTTHTRALLPGSPAINAGTNAGVPATDQRGIARVGAADIGAFESRGFMLAFISGNNQSAPLNTAFANPLIVTVGSAFNEPVSGGSVLFFPPITAGPAASFAPNPATINASNRASTTATANNQAGTYLASASTIGNSIDFTLTNIQCTEVTISPENQNLPGGTAGQFYNQTFTASGGTSPYTFSLVAGDLPGGLSLNDSTGAISGTPNLAGTFNFTIKATDDKNCEGTRSYVVTINPAGTNGGLQFYPLPAPVRLLDTRAGQVGCSAPGAPILGGTSRTQTASGFCSIPASARAVTGNITTVQSGGGYLTLYPSDAAQPLVANSNYNPNEILNNVFTVGLSATDGAFKIFVTSDTHVVVDVTGYYAPPGTASADGLYFHPLPKPIRLLETRAGFSGCTTPGAYLQGGLETIQPAHLTCDGVTIPNTAKAIVGNATTVNPSGPGFPYLTLFPADASRPLAASSNYLPGQVMNAPFTVGLSGTGEFKIYPTTRTDLVIDVLGYYSADATDANGAGLLFNPLPKPVRLLETRAGFTGCFATNTPLAAGSTRTQPARGACDGVEIAAGALGIVGNATVVNSGGGYLTFWPSTAAQPTVATSNFNLGQIFNRHFTVGLGAGDGAFKIFTQFQTDLVIDVSGYFAP